jgi:uncharacterized damage-inducible protein DinB
VSRGLTNARLDQEIDVGHRTLRAAFEHMIFNVEAWTGLMAGQQVIVQRDDRSLAALIDGHERSNGAFSTLARRMREERRLDETFVDHFGEAMTFGGAIVHVVLHNAEHRTEELHILERLGVPDLPEVDHGFWEHERRVTSQVP